MFEWKRRTTLHMNMNMNICSIQNRKWWRRMQKQEVAYLTNECLFLLMWNTIPATTYAYHNHSLHMQDTNTNVHFVFSVFFFFWTSSWGKSTKLLVFFVYSFDLRMIFKSIRFSLSWNAVSEFDACEYVDYIQLKVRCIQNAAMLNVNKTYNMNEISTIFLFV